jgi:hypothetical protein
MPNEIGKGRRKLPLFILSSTPSTRLLARHNLRYALAPTPLPNRARGTDMTISGVSHYRGGTIDEVLPLARALKAIYQKYGVGYRLSHVQDGPNAGDWLVVATYADRAAFEKCETLFAQDTEIQQVFTAISRHARRVSREMVVDLDI